MQANRAIAAWQPQGVVSLEPAAERVVRSHESRLVVAGPGAGKTELLAQRACFLLQTGVCRDPKRILAISFKRDAARNLRERVVQRCGRELAARFDSYTFDSFAKSLVDRFLRSIPAPFRPTADYELDTQLAERKARAIVLEMPSEATSIRTRDRHYISTQRLWDAFINRPLPRDGLWQNRSNDESAAADLWAWLLRGNAKSIVGFPMIGRLAALLLEANPNIVDALRRCYGYVFLDEYQDTTRVQYALVRAGFLGSDAVLTAVGDVKQRIMGWAGAMERAFDSFQQDFGAERVALERNYRSMPKLVEIQSVIAAALDESSSPAQSMRADSDMVDECRILAFSDDDAEATHLARLIRGWIATDGLKPRDICVLCRMKEQSYAGKLIAALDCHGVRARFEKELQDLLAEPLTECLVDVLRLACRHRAPEAWKKTVHLLEDLAEDGSDRAVYTRMQSLAVFVEDLAIRLADVMVTEEAIKVVLKQAMEFVGEASFRAAHPQYLQGSYYDDLLASLAKHLHEARKKTDGWNGALDDIEGVGCIPIMTMHKSKGLEYHSIVFVGLEDGALFGFEGRDSPKTIEEICGVFVALSRAKARALFSFSGMRDRSQSRDNLAPLYKLLEQAGVFVEVIA